MQCPVCGQEKTVKIKEKKYYCNHCNINIGAAPDGTAPKKEKPQEADKKNPYKLFGLFSSSREKENQKRYQKASFSMLVQKIALLLTVFFVLLSIVYYFFLYVDLEEKCFIRIYPSIFEFSTRNVIESIQILKQAAPSDYQNLCANIRVIDTNVACGGFEGGCYYETKPGVIHVSTNEITLTQTIAVIVHETCHSIQHSEGRPLEERECYYEDQRVLQELVRY